MVTAESSGWIAICDAPDIIDHNKASAVGGTVYVCSGLGRAYMCICMYVGESRWTHGSSLEEINPIALDYSVI